MSFLRKLFLSHWSTEFRCVRPAITIQNDHLKAVWNDEKENTFGIERLFKLFLVLSSYVFPGLYLRHISGKFGLLPRKICSEIYVIFKLITPIIIFRCNLEDSTFAIILISYLLLETLLYLLGVIFLSDIYSPPISKKRSYLMLVINYIEVCLGFAVLYKATGGVSELVSNFDAIYFSFITATTIGYGHMAPIGHDAKALAIIHSMYNFIFIGLILSNFAFNITYKDGTYRVKSTQDKAQKVDIDKQ
ncbi:two pore domain potassium channel family protein [Photobacterium aquimaris]|uniref:Two pore domain potassium channel family protein n=2 Tax=Photobacterium TaxID=657 RepID=A0A2T3ILM0_9GAMM|nr:MULTISPECIES: potassium channel family protein [Photobacterium]OBU22485.1 3-deoxy-manno-octulosonate cytidylyltransferase [Photobacterium aquimaris]PSU29236.1 two pore domain potassium channel family protein [Photobacterium aquimaris]SMY32114.1 Ion channel [Photobacterium malacitanum]